MDCCACLRLILLLTLSLHVAAHSTSAREQLTLLSDDSRTSNFMQRSMTSDAQLQLSMATVLRAGITATVDEFAETEADLEMGSDLRVDIGMNATSGGDGNGGPATLAEYCAGGQTTQEKQSKLGEGTKVMANWEGYGTKYAGEITDINRDGTVDIKYDDGFSEKRVDVDDVEATEKKASLLQQAAPRDDPACQLQEFLEKLKTQLKSINGMVHEWLAGQRAKVAGDKVAPPPPTSPPPTTVTASPNAAAAGAPAPAGPQTSSAQADELEKLKAQLAERDKFLAELEKMVADNEKELEKYFPVSAPSPSGIASVDDLIAQYKDKIAERDARIAELQKVLQQQHDELAKLSGKQLSLSAIDDAVRELEKDVAEAERKRDQLKEEGKLDPELRYIIDAIIKALKKLRAKVDNLLALEEKADKERKAADEAAALAAEKARKKAKEDGKDPEKAAKEAFEDAERKTSDALKTADLETMKAAQEMGKDLEEAEKGAVKLDTGLHPHGDKWWRYRYEHSYIEALVMIFVSFLMLLWSELISKLRIHVLRKAVEKDAPTVSLHQIVDDDTHGTVYVTWLRDFAEQMMVCIFVFLTIWIISKTALLDYAPMLIKPSDELRVPLTGAEYRHIALDVLTIFFFAIVIYFGLMFTVARHTRKVTKKLEHREVERKSVKDINVSAGVSNAAGARLSSALGYSMGATVFTDYLENEYKNGEPHMQDIYESLGGKLNTFPLADYLTLNVRLVVPSMFKFGWVMWLPTICLFVTLMFLHQFAHMGYVRIISFFAVLVLVLILGMAWYCESLERSMGDYKSFADLPTEKTFHNDFPTEVIFLGLLQFCLFFTCYGVARMICQPWMWELHFWPVLCLTGVAVVSAALFVWLVAPTIPIFVAAMALPPYVDEQNWEQVKYVAEKVAVAEKGK